MNSSRRDLFAAKPTTVDYVEAKVEKKNDGTVTTQNNQTKKKVVIRPSDKLPKICGLGPLNEIAYSTGDNQTLNNFALACLVFYHATQPVLNTRKLSHHVILAPTNANKAIVLAMLDANPELLRTKIKHSKDKSRVFKNKTVFQLARGAGDDDFCLALKSAFIKLHNGDEKSATEEMKRQHQEILESEKEEKGKEAVSKAHLEEILKSVISAIGAEQFNHGKDDTGRLKLSPETLAAINRFREEYAKIQFKVIDGMHFRYNTLSEAFAAYDTAEAVWVNNDYKNFYRRCALLEDSVLSTIESDLPVNDAQKAAQGLFYLQMETYYQRESYNRSVALRNDGRNFYEVVRGPSKEFVLDGCYVDISAGEERGVGRARKGMARRYYQILCQTKTKNFQSLMDLAQPEQKSQLVACRNQEHRKIPKKFA